MDKTGMHECLAILMCTQCIEGAYNTVYADITALNSDELLEYIDNNYCPISDLLIAIIDYYNTL